MAPPDERNGHNYGREGRRPWLMRYWPIFAIIIGFHTSIAAVGVKAWADIQQLKVVATETKDEVKSREKNVLAVPHIADDLAEHKKDFKEFRSDIGQKLDYIIRQLGTGG